MILALLLLPTLSRADGGTTVNTIFNHLALHQGIGFDIKSGNATSYTSTDLITWKDLSLSAGYSTSSAIVTSLDYDIGGLEKLGLNVPLFSIVDLRVGIMVGLSDISTASSSGTAERNKLFWGPEITIMATKF
jgi:hypothetical protein